MFMKDFFDVLTALADKTKTWESYKQLYVFIGIFFWITWFSLFLTYMYGEKEIVTEMWKLWFYGFLIFMIIYFLTLAKWKDIENREDYFSDTIKKLLDEIHAWISETGKKFNLLWDSSSIDKKDWLLVSDGEVTNSYFMKERGKSTESNYSWILILQTKENEYRPYYWLTENNKNTVYALWVTSEEIYKNFKDLGTWITFKTYDDILKNSPKK